jgi:hypothetical protein
MYSESANLTLVNSVFTGNASARHGGGMMNAEGTAVTMSNCTFRDNHAYRGGAIASVDETGYVGGSTTLVGCKFIGNTASPGVGIAYGGAIYGADDCEPVLVNCLFLGNSAGAGSAIAGTDGFDPLVINCTLADNTASLGGAVHVARACSTIVNSILWGNVPTEVSGPDHTIDYTCIQGGWGEPGGAGIIVADPLFADVGNEDFRLLRSSPCVDAGDNASVPAEVLADLNGGPRFHDIPDVPDGGSGTPPVVDIGAYEHSDCNENGVDDYEDITLGGFEDCTRNMIPDVCEPDCNENGIADVCDIAGGTSRDCQPNGVPDECDIADRPSMDKFPRFMGGDGVPDVCQLDLIERL